MTASAELPHRVRRDGPIRFFFDESALGIGRVMAVARADCIFPGHDRSPVQAGAGDVDWIPEVAARGWVGVVRDKRIHKRPAEKGALSAYPLRLLVLTSSGQLSVWEQLRVLVARWDAIEEALRRPPPWIYGVTKRRLREITYPERV